MNVHARMLRGGAFNIDDYDNEPVFSPVRNYRGTALSLEQMEDAVQSKIGPVIIRQSRATNPRWMATAMAWGLFVTFSFSMML